MMAVVIGAGLPPLEPRVYMVTRTVTGEPRGTVSCKRGADEQRVCEQLAAQGGVGKITGNGEPLLAWLITVDDLDDQLPSGLTERQLIWCGALMVASSIGLTAYRGLHLKTTTHP